MPQPAAPDHPAPRRRRRPAQPRRGRPNWLQRFFDRHPRFTAGAAALVLGYGTVLCSIRLAQAGRTVTSGYGVAVAAGLALPLALIAAVILIWRARRRSGVLVYGSLGLAALWFGCFIYAGPAVYNHNFPLEVITSPAQTAALAVTTMGWAALTALTGLIIVRPPDSGSRGWRDAPPPGPEPGLITGLAGPRKGGWSVTWVCAGRAPDRIHAPSLSQAAAAATAEVAALFAAGALAAGAATEFQLAIYPWPYHGGPIFEITGYPGDFTARDSTSDGGASLHGATLEDLLTAAQQMPGGHGAMFRWARPVSALPPAGLG